MEPKMILSTSAAKQNILLILLLMMMLMATRAWSLVLGDPAGECRRLADRLLDGDRPDGGRAA